MESRNIFGSQYADSDAWGKYCRTVNSHDVIQGLFGTKFTNHNVAARQARRETV